MAKGIILGAGITGLSAGIVTGLPIYERSKHVGGICRSYRYNLEGNESVGEDSFRFENGGGHWIFGADDTVKAFLSRFGNMKSYKRNSGVFFQRSGPEIVPFPIQENIWAVRSNHRKSKWIGDLIDAQQSYIPSRYDSMDTWLVRRFGKSMYEDFFHPFNVKYTGGLSKMIAPQDAYKNPVNIKRAVLGTIQDQGDSDGYNNTFIYPEEGLDTMCDRMADRCGEVHLERNVSFINLNEKTAIFDDGARVEYDFIISTLPLTTMVKLTGLKISGNATDRATEPPSTPVFVLNIGGVRGDELPDGHWYYIVDQFLPFHRIGVYSNVDSLFVPYRDTEKYVSFYVETTPVGIPSHTHSEALKESALNELRRMRWLKEELVVKADIIEPAYTWDYPANNWVSQAKQRLGSFGVHQLGRYANWKFQGIAESIREGFSAAMIMESYS